MPQDAGGMEMVCGDCGWRGQESTWRSECKGFPCELKRMDTPMSNSELLAEEEAYELGLRDGYSKAIQEIDQLTGGDGEYRYCTNHDPERHCPDPETMKARIVERFDSTQLDELRAENERLVGAFRETKAALSLTTLVEDLDGVRECIAEIKSRIDRHISKALGGQP